MQVSSWCAPTCKHVDAFCLSCLHLLSCNGKVTNSLLQGEGNPVLKLGDTGDGVPATSSECGHALSDVTQLCSALYAITPSFSVSKSSTGFVLAIFFHGNCDYPWLCLPYFCTRDVMNFIAALCQLQTAKTSTVMLGFKWGKKRPLLCTLCMVLQFFSHLF